MKIKYQQLIDEIISYKNVFLPLFMCLIAALVVFLYFFYKNNYVYYRSTIYIDDVRISVDVADTTELRQKGLSNRRMLCDKCGMLFLFDESKKYSFWMKDMLFDIDVIWIQNDHIVGVERAISHKNKEKKVFYSPELANRALEVPSGTIDRYFIHSGQKVEYVDNIFEK